MSILEVKNLTFTYGIGTPYQKTALADVSFALEKGDFVGVIGHTGSGKSTLMQHLNGLIRCPEGHIFLDGADIWEKPKEIRSVRFRVGLVFQYPEYQLFEDTVRKDIAYGARNMGLSDEEADRRVREAARDVDLREELLDVSPFELSGGQKRRAAIAGVLAMKPEVLILDEPTAGLDPQGRARVLELLKNYREQNDVTVVLVSHNMENIAAVTNKVLVMNDGAAAMFDRTEAVFDRAAELTAMGLSVPTATRVFLRLKERGLVSGRTPYTNAQAVSLLAPLCRTEGGRAHAE